MSFKQCRLRAGLTQEVVSEKLGVDRTTVSKWDLMVSTPRGELLPKVSSLYGCTIDDLFAPEPDETIISKNEDDKND